MNVLPLSDRPEAIRLALLSHGWEGDLARLSAHGTQVRAYIVTGVNADAIESMVRYAPRLGLDVVTGDDWIILAGTHARLGAFARPWTQPEPLQEFATALGRALPADRAPAWQVAGKSIELRNPVMVGIVNVTPDSFSDGGVALAPADAIRLAHRLVQGGAGMLDVGGESTRPGATPLDAKLELTRVLPVIELLASELPEIPISIDTVRAKTARAAIDAGAVAVNDVTAGRHDPAIFQVVRDAGAGMVLMHSRGALGELASYAHANYGPDVTTAVVDELCRQVRAAAEAGIAADSLVVDPGLGFSKRSEHSLQLLHQLDAVAALGYPVMLGPSRKRFLGDATGRDVHERDAATAAACVLGFERGARLFRIHDPASVRDALAVAARSLLAATSDDAAGSLSR